MARKRSRSRDETAETRAGAGRISDVTTRCSRPPAVRRQASITTSQRQNMELLMSKRLTLLAAAADPRFDRRLGNHHLRGDGGKHRHRRRRADVSVEEHRAECGQLQGPHHAGRGGQGRGPGRDAEGPGPLPCSRRPTSLRQAAGRHRRQSAQAGEQGDADQDADLSRRARPHDCRQFDESVKDGEGEAKLKTVAGEGSP